MEKNKTNLYVFVSVILIVLSVILVVSGVVSWFSSGSYKTKFILAALSFVSAIVFPVVAIIVSTKREESSNDRAHTTTASVTTPTETESKTEETFRVISQNEVRIKFDEAINKIPLFDIQLSSNGIIRQRLSDMPEIKMSNITRASNPERIFPLVVLDTETTGFQPSSHAIIELSAIKFDYPFAPVAAFSTLVNPERRIPADASKVNGITNDMVKDSPLFSEIAPSFYEFIQGCNICGHNLLFDLRFLFASGLELPSGVKYYDTLSLSRKALVKEGSKDYNHHTGHYEENEEWDVVDHKLETICEHYGIYRSTQHRALSDAYATALVFKNLLFDKADIYIPYPQVTSDVIEGKKESTFAESVEIVTEKASVDHSLLVEDVKSTQKKPKQSTEKNIKRSAGRRIIQLDNDGNVLAQFDSVADAFRATGINQKSLRDAANGIQKHAGGYAWKFNDTNETEILKE